MYALWLVPPAEISAAFAALISELSATLGTFPFAPHVTLLAGIEGESDDLRQRAVNLASRIAPITIEPLRVVLSDEFYRAVVLEVRRTEPLLTARAAAEDLFGRHEDDFWPHLSLVYGNLSVAQQREVWTRVGSLRPEPFEAAALQMLEIKGTPAEWSVICGERL